MCICHYCGILGLCIGEILYAVQKLVQCLAVGSVFTCLMLSFTVILMLGIGLGYNHAYVEIAGTTTTTTPAPMNKSLRSDYNNERKAEDIANDVEISNVEHPMRSQRSIANISAEDYPLSATVVIPLRPQKNILQLLRKIRKRRSNVTLEIIAT